MKTFKKTTLALAAIALAGCIGPGPYPHHPNGPGYTPLSGNHYEDRERPPRPAPPDYYDRERPSRPPQPDYYNRDDRRPPPPPDARRREREDDERRGPGPGRHPEDD